MKLISFFYLIMFSVLFEANVYASDDMIKIVTIDDDRLLIKKINTTVTKSARKFFHRSANNHMDEEQKVYDVDYKKFYFINDHKDVLFTINFVSTASEDLSTRVPSKVLFNLKEYKDFMRGYEIYLQDLVSAHKSKDVYGKEYYEESVDRIASELGRFKHCMNSIINKKRVYLSEFSSLIYALAAVDRNKARIKQEISVLERFYNQETQTTDYRKVSVALKDFITSADTLTDANL